MRRVVGAGLTIVAVGVVGVIAMWSLKGEPPPPPPEPAGLTVFSLGPTFAEGERMGNPFNVVTTDRDGDGDLDAVVNFHVRGLFELYDQTPDGFVAVPDQAGIWENDGVADLYTAPTPGEPGVYVWHDPDRKHAWRFQVVGSPVLLQLRVNQEVQKITGLRPADYGVDGLNIDIRAGESTGVFGVNTASGATQIVISVTPPVRIFAGADATPMVPPAELWKQDPHGMAWLDVTGDDAPDLFVTRGALRGLIQPPLDPKRDRLFVYEDGRYRWKEWAGNYGRGRNPEWVDSDGDGVLELFVGNEATPNSLYDDGVDIAPQLSLDDVAGVPFAWLDFDGDGAQDLITYTDAALVLRLGPSFAERRKVAAFPGKADQEQIIDETQLHVADFDCDGQLDVWLSGYGPKRRLHPLRREGDAYVPVTGVPKPRADEMVVHDFDLDGDPDVLLRAGKGALRLLENVPGAYVRHDLPLSVAGYRAMSAADVDGDGAVDLFLASKTGMAIATNVLAAAKGNTAQSVVLPSSAIGTVVKATQPDGRVCAWRWGSHANDYQSQTLRPLLIGSAASVQ